MVSNSSRRWKVRAMPRRARRWGEVRVMSVPPKWTRPRVGGWRPVITLNSVVLPAPLGPMSPCTLPASTDTSTSFRAWIPPKRTVICSATSSANGTHLRLDGSARGRGGSTFHGRTGGGGPPGPVVGQLHVHQPDPVGVAAGGHDTEADEDLRELEKADAGGDDGKDGDEQTGGDGPGEHAHPAQGHA